MHTSQPLGTRYKKSLTHGVYAMENKDTKTDYHEDFRVGDQKWEMIETTIGIILLLLLLLFDIHIHYFLYM